MDCLAVLRVSGFSSSAPVTDNCDLANSSVDSELWRVDLFALSREREFVLILGREDEGAEVDDASRPRRRIFATAGDELRLLLASDERSSSVLGVTPLEARLGVADRDDNVDVPVPTSDGRGGSRPVDDGVTIFPSLTEWRIALLGEDARTIEGEDSKG